MPLVHVLFNEQQHLKPQLAHFEVSVGGAVGQSAPVETTIVLYKVLSSPVGVLFM